MADSSVAITAGSGTPIRVLTALGAGNADQQVVTLADSAGNLLGTNAAPFPVGVQSAIDPDTVATGTITATDAVVAAPAGNGVLLTGTPTAASFVSVSCPGGDTSWVATVGATASTFGSGTVYFEGSFDGGTTYVPLNGRQTGVVNTVLGYSTTTAGAYRGNTAGATQIRARIVGATTPSVSVTLRVASGVGGLFLNASIPGGTNTIGTVLNGAGTAYIGQVRLTDGTNNPAVKAASTAAAAADPSLVVGLHPSSPVPVGANLIGAVAVGATTPSASFYTSTTTNAATVAKASAGNIQALLLSNTSASVQYVKLFNATTVTLGTTAAVADIALTAAGSAGATVALPLGPNGLRMSTGIAYAVTGAVGAANNTAGAGGVLVALTYV